MASAALPMVTVDGPAIRTITPTQPVQLLVTASVSDCQSLTSSTPLSYAWTLSSAVRNPNTTEDGYELSLTAVADLAETLSGASSYIVTLPASALQVGMVYVVDVTVTAEGTVPVSNTASVTIEVRSAGMVAYVVGGDRVVGVDTIWSVVSLLRALVLLCACSCVYVCL
jgi:hypothetical protein